MIIGVAGPYSAETAEQRKLNLDAMNMAAAKLLELGHIPIIGMNAALPVLEKAHISDVYKATMDISLAVINACEGLLLLAESPGANKERDLILSKGLPVFTSIEEKNWWSRKLYMLKHQQLWLTQLRAIINWMPILTSTFSCRKEPLIFFSMMLFLHLLMMVIQ